MKRRTDAPKPNWWPRPGGGFRHVETQLEPIAAALAYQQTLNRAGLSLIVDLGSGTSDFVIAQNLHYLRRLC